MAVFNTLAPSSTSAQPPTATEISEPGVVIACRDCMEREVWRLSDDAVYRCRNSTLYVGGSEESARTFRFYFSRILKRERENPQNKVENKAETNA